MNHAPEDPHFTINIVQGQHGAEFDLHELHLPAGAVTVWINQTDASQVILPLNKEARRVMTLAPIGQEGKVWMIAPRKPEPFAGNCNPIPMSKSL
jgi:hypothetical protein